jgi:hypothetical protein
MLRRYASQVSIRRRWKRGSRSHGSASQRAVTIGLAANLRLSVLMRQGAPDRTGNCTHRILPGNVAVNTTKFQRENHLS